MAPSHESIRAWWEHKGHDTLVGHNSGASQGHGWGSEGREGRIAWALQGGARVRGPLHTHSTQASLVLGGKATCLRLAYASWLWLEMRLPAHFHPHGLLRPSPALSACSLPFVSVLSPAGHISVLRVQTQMPAPPRGVEPGVG